jgi:hypothetical protein
MRKAHFTIDVLEDSTAFYIFNEAEPSCYSIVSVEYWDGMITVEHHGPEDYQDNHKPPRRSALPIV